MKEEQVERTSETDPQKPLKQPSSIFKSEFLKIAAGVTIGVLFFSTAFVLGRNTAPKNTTNETIVPSPASSATEATSDSTANWKTYTDSIYGYSFDYPSEVKKATQNELSQQSLSGSIGNDHPINSATTKTNTAAYTIYVFKAKASQTIQDWINKEFAYPNDLKIENASLGNMQAKSTIPPGGCGGDGGCGQFELTFTLKGGYIYVVEVYSFSIDPHKQQTNNHIPDIVLTDYNKMVSSFKFTSPTAQTDETAKTPTSIVNDFYSAYINCSKKQTEDCSVYRTNAVLSKTLITKISQANDIDLLLCAQNFPLTFNTDEAKVTGNTASTVVHTYFGQSVDNPIKVSLEKLNNQWLISDITCKQ